MHVDPHAPDDGHHHAALGGPSRDILEERRAGMAILLTGIFVLLVILAYAGKAVCLDGEPGFWGQTRYCYSDVRVLWSFRGFDVDALPFAGAPVGYIVDYTFEYPPGLGFGAWLVALLTDSRRAFFEVTSATFVVCLVAVFWSSMQWLRRQDRDPTRLVGLALSPAILLFAFQNWDLWAVAPAFLGVAAMQRGKLDRAGLWVGLGFAMKWWPGLLGLLLVFGPWAPSKELPPRERWRPAMIAAGTGLLLQVPALLASPSGWLDAHLFHARRTTNLESGLQGIHDFGQRFLPSGFWDGGWWTTVSVVTIAGLVGGLVHVGRRLDRRTIDPADAALAIVVLFLLCSRVASPQFVLWILPFAVVSRVNWLPVLAVEMLNAMNWLLYGPALAGGDRGFLHAAQAVGLLRRIAIGWLLYEVLRRSDRAAPSSAMPAAAAPAPVAGSGTPAGASSL